MNNIQLLINKSDRVITAVFRKHIIYRLNRVKTFVGIKVKTLASGGIHNQSILDSYLPYQVIWIAFSPLIINNPIWC